MRQTGSVRENMTQRDRGLRLLFEFREEGRKRLVQGGDLAVRHQGQDRQRRDALGDRARLQRALILTKRALYDDATILDEQQRVRLGGDRPSQEQIQRRAIDFDVDRAGAGQPIVGNVGVKARRRRGLHRRPALRGRCFDRVRGQQDALAAKADRGGELLAFASQCCQKGSRRQRRTTGHVIDYTRLVRLLAVMLVSACTSANAPERDGFVGPDKKPSATAPRPTPSIGDSARIVPTAAPKPPTDPAPPRPTASVAPTTPAELRSTKPTAWGQRVDGVVRQLPASTPPRLALTFDACGGPGGNGYDEDLINTLKREGIAATLFLSARWIDKHEAVAKALAEDALFDIENHGAKHKPCSVTGRGAFGIPGTRSVDDARAEIFGGSQRIESLTGRTPTFFRPGTGYLDDVCVELVHALGARPVGFGISDHGGGLSRSQIQRALESAPDGSIVLFHMNKPRSATAEGLADALPKLRDREIQFVRLAEALNNDR